MAKTGNVLAGIFRGCDGTHPDQFVAKSGLMMDQPFLQATCVNPVRNMQIRDDQIDVLFLEQGAGFQNVLRRLYTMIAAPQNGSYGFQNGVIVIDQKDSSTPSPNDPFLPGG